MASILSLIAGLVVGAITGWLLRGRQIARTQSTEAHVPAQPAGPAVAAEPAEAAGDADKVPALVGATSEDAGVPAPPPAAATEPAAAESVAIQPAAGEPVAAQPVAAEPVAAEPVAAETVAAEPVVAAVPVEAEVVAGQTVAEPDDLTRIAGIGPKMAMALAASGITTFDQLAASSLADIRAAVTAAGMRLAPTAPTWPEQAKRLAGLAD